MTPTSGDPAQDSSRVGSNRFPSYLLSSNWRRWHSAEAEGFWIRLPKGANTLLLGNIRAEVPLDTTLTLCPNCGGTIETAVHNASLSKDDAY